MKIYKLLICLLVVLANYCCQGKLKIVAEIYRHGARGSLSSFYDGNDQPEIAGELTATGQRQHYNLGLFLREEYINQQKFMPDKYNHSLIYVRADDFNRTIMSAYSHFQGFYPEGFGDILPSNLSYQYTLPPFRSSNIDLNTTKHLGLDTFPHLIQVLPVHVISRDTDYVFLAADICPNYSLYQAEYQNKTSELYQAINSQMSDTLTSLTSIFNQSIPTIRQADQLIDVIYSDTFNARYVPPIPDQVQNNLTFIFNFFSFYNSERGVKIITQPYFEDIFGYFDQIISGKSDLRWISHSGHDSNVGPILQALNFSSINCTINDFYQQGNHFLNCAEGPNFASHILFEVHENEGYSATSNPKDSLYFKVRYNGQYMKLCGTNTTVCSYNQFESNLISTFENYNELCGKNTNSLISASQNSVNEIKTPNGIESYFTFSNFSQILIQIVCISFLIILYRKTKFQQKEISVLRERLQASSNFDYEA